LASISGKAENFVVVLVVHSPELRRASLNFKLRAPKGRAPSALKCEFAGRSLAS
jgi:hypothetical protein